MKVLLVSPIPPPSGGIARWTQLYLSACSNYGIEATLVNTNISAKRASDQTRSYTLIDEIKRSFSIVKNVYASMYAKKPDLAHICSPCSRYGLFRDLLIIRACKKIPVVFHCHCNIEDQARTKISRFVLRIIVQKSKTVIVLTDDSTKVIDDIEENKAIIVPNFIEDEKVFPNHEISQHLKTIIYVGHVKIKKGITEIFSVANKCENKEFIVVGPVQELPENIKQPNNVILTGEITHDQVASYMKQADAFLFPSYTEGFANVMLEAMGSGLPIIASDVGANKDMIESQGGIIVPPKNWEAIVSALTEMEDPEVRRKMSEWNLEKVRSYYTLSKVIPVINRCYGVRK